MSSANIYGLDVSIHRHSSSDMLFSYNESRDLLVFTDPFPFPFFTGSPIDIAQNNSLDPFSLSFFSFSPSNYTPLDSQSLYQGNHEQPLPNGPNLESEFTKLFSALDGSEVKSEECQMGGGGVVDNNYNHHQAPYSDSGAESVSNVMQRSNSCNSFDGIGKPGFLFEAHRNTFMDSPDFQWHALSSPENSFFTGQLRRVFSAGDLQNTKVALASQTKSESKLREEANFKVGRYSAEERKEKISKYRAKRSQRKFNKTIKYACRKTLADNRARIRGRFARNDETSSVIPKASCSARDEDHREDEFWIDLVEGLNDEVLS